MSILVSDYDGTIKTFNKNPGLVESINFKKNIKAINGYIKDGNTFVITTGRITSSIIDEVNKYDINYNYLTTGNGLITIDNNNNVVTAKYLEKETLKLIKYLIENNLLVKSSIYDEFSKVDNKNLDNAVLCSLYFRNRKELAEYKDLFNQQDDLEVSTNLFTNKVWINRKSSKSDGLKELLDILGIDNRDDVYTVGNSKNDLGLITDYNGYGLILSDPSIQAHLDKRVPSVHSLIKKIK